MGEDGRVGSCWVRMVGWELLGEDGRVGSCCWVGMVGLGVVG